MRRHSAVAVIDERDFRRACVMGLLEPWANSERLGLMPFNPHQMQGWVVGTTDLKMVIFSIGGNLFSDGGILNVLEMLRARLPSAPLVIISDRDDANDVILAMNSGAKGYIFSGIDSPFAFQALSFILHGGTYFPPSAIREFRKQKPGASNLCSENLRGQLATELSSMNGTVDAEFPKMKERDAVSAPLTFRQQEVLDHIRLGETNKIIGRHLGMTEGTVKVHVRQIMRKLGASNRTQLAIGRVMANGSH